MKHITFCYGRYQPPHIGHRKLMSTTAGTSSNGEYAIFASTRCEPKKNPLPYVVKTQFIKEMFPEFSSHVHVDENIKDIMQVATHLYKCGYRSATFVGGVDQIDEFKELLNKYNGTNSSHGFYKFDSLNFVTSDSPEVHATQIRECVKLNDFNTFARLTSAGELSKPLYDAVQKGLNEKTKRKHVN